MIKRSESARRVSQNAWLILLVAGLVCGGVFWRWAETTVYAATFVVNTTADSDDGVCSSAASGCTLREAINAANAGAGADTINFNIPGSGVKTIQLNSDLPAITGLLTINGYSQPGASPNTLTHANNAVLLIELSGGYTEGGCCPERGLHLAGGGNFVKGLIINRFKGAAISIPSNENSIQGNYIGTDPDGTQALGNNIGVSSNAKNVLVGGMSPGDRNVISGNRQDGIQANGDDAPVSTQVLNNLIGTASDGVTPLGNFRGIFLFDASHTDSRNNIIAFNHREGILVSENSTDNTILANSIHSNGSLGIDLRGGAEDSLDVTANDTGDADTGANSLQNFPIITSVDVQAVSTLVFFKVDSTPNTSLTVQLFTNDSCDPSGHGEGQNVGPTFTVNSGPTGMATFQLGFGPNAPYFTMTATGPNGTSEFSPCVAAVDKTFTVNTNADTNDGVCNTTHCTLREAINAANATTDLDAIVFNIPGAGVHTIAPASPLPNVNEPVVIDGYTQPGTNPNTLQDGDNAVLLIELNGAGAGGGVGLALEGGSSVVRGLVINRFSSGSGIAITMTGGNVVAGNFIGTDQAGASALGNVVGIGVVSDGNRIGGLLPRDRNIISGNSHYGIDIVSTSASANVVQGNFIGTTATGTAALANVLEGVRMTDSGFTQTGMDACRDWWKADRMF